MRRLLARAVVIALGLLVLVGASSRAAADTPPGSLWSGQTLASGASLLTPSREYRLDMQTDGNLVLYGLGTSPAAVRFASGTFGHPGATATLQQDDNFVVYDTSGRALWWSGVQSSLPSRLDVQDDGTIDQYLTDGSSPWAAGQAQFPVSADHVLHAGQVMTPTSGQITSPSGRFDLGVGAYTVESFENESAPGVIGVWEPIWQPVSGQTGVTLTFTLQTDGNLVLYRNGSTPSWSSGTVGSGADRFAVQDDGNLVLYAGGRAVWSTLTTPRILVTTQTLAPGTRWVESDEVETRGLGGTLTMQSDGNLVTYDEQGHPRWSTGTAGHPGSRLLLQSDGNLVVYDVGGVPLWSTGTAGCGRNTRFAFGHAVSDGEGVELRHGSTLVWDGTGRKASC